jgi:C1q domain/Major tropism determinant N-terminal domain
MSKIVQHRRGRTSDLSTILGAAGELFVDTSLGTVVVHDGVTTGGTTLATQAQAKTTATTTQLGVSRPDNTSITISAGVLSAATTWTTSIALYAGITGSSVGQTIELASLQNSHIGNYNYLRFLAKRNASGFDWLSASNRIQNRVDATDQAYIEFNPYNYPYGIALGVGVSGSSQAVIIDQYGRMQKPFTPAFLATTVSAGYQTSNANTVMPFNSLNNTFAGTNRNSYYNTSTYAFTAPVPGLYEFYVQIFVNANNLTYQLAWRKNGAEAVYGDTALAASQSLNNSPSQIIINGRVTFELATGDYIQVGVRSSSNNIYWYGGHSFFSGNLIG